MTLLTIAIPTYNRYEYLKELLPVMIEQCKEETHEFNEIEIIVCDNASTDATRETVLKYPEIKYYRNDYNIGGDANFINCVEKATGDYVWLFGDDDILLPGAIGSILPALIPRKIDLIILTDREFNTKQFDSVGNYNEFIKATRKHKWFLLAHTLITCNIFKKPVFIKNTAEKMKKTNYGHMYALIDGVSRGGSVFVFCKQLIRVRTDDRAKFDVDVQILLIKHVQYLIYLGKTFNENKIVLFIIRRFVDGCIGYLKRIFF